MFFTQGDQRIGGTYQKAIYEEYTSSSFTTKKSKPSHLGFLGPVIRAEVGDVIEVVFKNNVSKQLQETLSWLKYRVFMIMARRAFLKTTEGAKVCRIFRLKRFGH